jgi:hypothetical protein
VLVAASVAYADQTPVGQVAPAGASRSTGWTAERMGAAKELPLKDIDAATLEALKKRAAGMAVRGAPTIVEHGELKPYKPEKPGKPDKPKPPEGAGNYQPPLTWVGKVFFSTPDGDYSCSGGLIAPDLVVTAAACVQEQESGDWYSDIAFGVQFKEGNSLAEITGKCWATLKGWADPSDDTDPYFYDYAVIKLDSESPVGNLGLQINWGDENYETATMLGYAGSDTATAIKGKLAPSEDGFVTLTHGKKGNFSGILGAPIVAKYAEKADADSNMVISLSAFSYKDEPGVQYGPYFDDSFKILFDYAAGGCQ